MAHKCLVDLAENWRPGQGCRISPETSSGASCFRFTHYVESR